MTEEFELKIKEYQEAFYCIDKDRDGDIATPELVKTFKKNNFFNFSFNI